MQRYFFCASALFLAFTLDARAQDANFDSLTEGQLGNMFTENGILFQNPDSDIPGTPPTFVCDQADGDLAGMPGFSGPNGLGLTTFTSGPHAGFSRMLSFEMTTGQSVDQASLELWVTGANAGNLITLDALNNHTVVNTQFVSILPGVPLQHFSLSVSGVPFLILRIRGTGMTDNGAFFGIVDNVHFGPLPPGTTYCAGDGSATACPCGNASAFGMGLGCASSLGFGARLSSSGTPSLTGDTLVLLGTQMPDAPCLYFQGTTQANGGSGSVFGDGLRCAGGTIVRLGSVTNSSGASQYPSGSQASVSVRGQVSAPGVREYQIWYRNAAPFCSPSTFNLTNGHEITWAP